MLHISRIILLILIVELVISILGIQLVILIRISVLVYFPVGVINIDTIIVVNIILPHLLVKNKEWVSKYSKSSLDTDEEIKEL